jgi:hypothetical protein
VKIITRRTAEEAGDQWLTEEDTKSFRELLINLLVITILKNQPFKKTLQSSLPSRKRF